MKVAHISKNKGKTIHYIIEDTAEKVEGVPFLTLTINTQKKGKTEISTINLKSYDDFMAFLERNDMPQSIMEATKKRFEELKVDHKIFTNLFTEKLREMTKDPEVALDSEVKSHLYLLLILKREGWGTQLVMEWYWKPRTKKELLLFYPYGASMQGFLGWGESLDTVIEGDQKQLERMGISREVLAQKLQDVLQSGTNDQYDVETIGYLGYQECPFCDKVQEGFSDIDFVIRNKANGNEVKGPGLIAHLIAEHGFFEGHRSPYRVDPEALVKTLF